MKIIVCIKQVPNTSEVKINPDGTLKRDGVPSIMNPDDKAGLEFALRLKEEHGEVFVTNIAGIQIIWRKLKRSEYKEIMSTKFDANEDIQYFERQDAMAKKVILYPENVDRLLEDYAGVSDIIATETMIKTGFGIANTKAVK